MIKVLYLPLNTPTGIQHGTYDAWEQSGVDFKIYDYFMNHHNGVSLEKNRIGFVEAVSSFQPDLVHMQLQMTGIIDSDTILMARSFCKKSTIFTNWSGDVRNHAAQEIVSVSKAVDYTLLSNTGQIPLYTNAGCPNVRYWQIGYDPKLYYPKNNQKFKYDLIFAGNTYAAGAFADSGLRNNMLAQLKRRLGDRFAVFGTGYHRSLYGPTRIANGPEINDLYNQSRCILSISNYNDISHYFSDRLLICLASGRPTISYRFPKFDSYFSHNSDILIANSVEDILAQVEYCKNNPEKANHIGLNGYRKVFAEHTFKSRIIELLTMLGLIK